VAATHSQRKPPTVTFFVTKDCLKCGTAPTSLLPFAGGGAQTRSSAVHASPPAKRQQNHAARLVERAEACGTARAIALFRIALPHSQKLQLRLGAR
jgi:hypothetical protein